MYIHITLHISVGFLNSTITRLYGYFWLLYICHLTLKILYPLKSASLLSDHKRVVYFAEILIGILIATVPSIVNTVLSNYAIIRFPPVQCGNSNGTQFYALILPTMTTVCVTGILMSLTLYKIHVVSLMV